MTQAPLDTPTQTLACGGAPAQPRVGLARTAVMSIAAIAEIIAVKSNKEVAAFLAPIIAGFQYDLTNICTAGDPGDPQLTQQDFADLADYFNIPAFNAAVKRVQQYFVYIAFPLWCQCADGTFPPNVTPVLPPAVTTNPNLPAGGVGSGCWDATTAIHETDQFDISLAGSLPQLGFMSPFTGSTRLAPVALQTPLPTSISVAGVYNHDHPPGGTWSITISFYDSAHVEIGSGGIFSNSTQDGVPNSVHGPVPANAAYVHPQINKGTFANSAGTFSGSISLFCGTDTPTTPVVPCCPPDDSLTQLIQQVLTYEHIIIQLLQAPGGSGYTDGTRHSNLSGTGSVLLVDAALALRIEIVSQGTAAPVVPGTPTYYYNVGFVTPFELGSAYRSTRVTFSNQVVVLPNFVDQIGYTLLNGAIVNIVELLRA